MHLVLTRLMRVRGQGQSEGTLRAFVPLIRCAAMWKSLRVYAQRSSCPSADWIVTYSLFAQRHRRIMQMLIVMGLGP